MNKMMNKSVIPEIISVFFYQELLHSSTIFTHYINMSQKDTSIKIKEKKRNLQLPDRKHLFTVAVAEDTVITENR